MVKCERYPFQKGVYKFWQGHYIALTTTLYGQNQSSWSTFSPFPFCYIIIGKCSLTITEGLATHDKRKQGRDILFPPLKHGLNQPCKYRHICQLHCRSNNRILKNESLFVVNNFLYPSVRGKLFNLVETDFTFGLSMLRVSRSS